MELRRVGTNITSETRRESHATVNKNLRYEQIIEVMQEFGKPMSAKQIAVKMFQKGYIPTSERNFTAPRLTELSMKNIVEPIGKDVCEYTHKSVSFYKLV